MAYRPAQIARESVITKAAEEIRRLIQADKLKAGEPLPPETQLSKMLGISRNSIREALRVLDGLGIVAKQPGRRVSVGIASRIPAEPFDRTAVLEAVPVAHQTRMVIEAKCAELLADAWKEADLVDIESQLSLFEEAIKRGDLAVAAHTHAAFHAALVEAAGNPILSSMYEQVRFVVLEMSRQGQETFKERRQLSLHAAIVRAIHARDGRRAVTAIRRHFQAVAPVIEFLSKDPRDQ